MRDRFRFLIIEFINYCLKNNTINKLGCIFLRISLILLSIRNYGVYKYYAKISRALSLTCTETYKKVENNFIGLLNSKISINEPFILQIYLKGNEAKKFFQEFEDYGSAYQARIKFPRKNDDVKRQGDLVVLKRYINSTEKGVLLIQYNDSMKRLAAIYDLPKLAKFYRIVLEPSTWGYQYIEFLNFLNLETEIIVEAQRREDYEYIEKIGNNLVPVRIGAGDWINPDLFSNFLNKTKIYDLIMIASWQSLKRHDLLFREISKIKHKISKIALVGYPINGRTKNDIFEESKKYGVLDLLDIFEEIPNEKVSELLQNSKFSVMLTKREGANKSIYESLFTNVPVVVTNCNVGVNREHINEKTGIFADDAYLKEAILYMKENYHVFTPRDWALNNTGCYNSTNTINNLLKKLSFAKGEYWTTDIYQRKGGGKHILFDEEYYFQAEKEFNFLAQNFLRSID